MKITLQGFGGTLPKVEPRYLPDSAAVEAVKTRIDRGHLGPIRAPLYAYTTGGAPKLSFYVAPPGSGIPNLYFTAADVDVVLAPIEEKTLVIAGNAAYPQKYSGGAFSDLRFPPPTLAPTVSITAGALDPDTVQTTYFAYTLLSGAMESAPSPLSVALDTSPNQTVLISGLPTTHSKRIYRSQTSFSGATELFFVAEIALLVSSASHTLASSPLGEAISSTDYDPAPDDLRGFVSMPNGIIAGFSGRDVCFTEPYIIHAWPEKYRLTVNDDIVGLVSFGTSLAVLTTGYPYVIQGLHPESMAMTRLESTAPCLSKRGIADVGYAAVYPSSDGLVQISGSGVQNMTEGLFTRSQWQALQPETIVGAQFRGGYAFTHQGAGGTPPLKMISKDGGSPSLIDMGVNLKHLQFDPYEGRLLGLHGNGVDVLSIDDEASVDDRFFWKSKPFRLPGPVPFGVVYVDAQEPTSGAPFFKVRVFMDGVNVAPLSMGPNVITRLAIPETIPQVVEVEIESNYTVTRILVCGDPSEVFQ